MCINLTASIRHLTAGDEGNGLRVDRQAKHAQSRRVARVRGQLATGEPREAVYMWAVCENGCVHVGCVRERLCKCGMCARTAVYTWAMREDGCVRPCEF